MNVKSPDNLSIMTEFVKYFFALILSLCALSIMNAQQFEGGVATYQTKTSMNMEGWGGGREMSEQQKKQIAERMKNMLEKTFTLKFTKEESIYEEIQKLETPGAAGGGMRWGGSFSQGGVYKNIANGLYARENDLMGKAFLVKDSLSKLDWKLEKESKMIGQYAAFKATAVRKAEAAPWEAMRRNRSGEAATDQDAAGLKEEVITAWYTPQVPVSQGPDEYWGLPGLILEVSAGPTVILCTRIVINPKEGLQIDKPKKGKEITRSEYEAIVLEKAKEMSERMGRGGRGPGGRN